MGVAVATSGIKYCVIVEIAVSLFTTEKSNGEIRVSTPLHFILTARVLEGFESFLMKVDHVQYRTVLIENTILLPYA